MYKAAIAVGIILITACHAAKSNVKTYDFATVTRGNLERTVTSSGTINPVSTVKVLPRMSGKVENINVDFNDQVKAGQVLAVLNTDMLKLQRDQQNASVQKAQANYDLQRINYQNQQTLADKNLISEYDLKTSKTTLDGLSADLASAKANLQVIETEINQYAYITSPIDGIVLDRNINVGDTVVDSSSNNSSTIFTLAENLKEMQIEASVSELDVVSIEKGQAVRFTLESLPGRTFSGTVETLRLVPAVTNSVVSYTVIINVENQDGVLLPGMTCAVDFIVEKSENVLMIPNAALRYQPSNMSTAEIADMVFNASIKDLSDADKQKAIEARAKAKTTTGQNNQAAAGLAGLMMGGGGRRPRGQQNQQGAGQARHTTPVVIRNLWYISSDGKPDVIQVQAGISDGTSTEVTAKDNIEGKQFILREKI